MDDVLGSAQFPKGREPQSPRAASSLHVPEPTEHELEVGRFDSALVGVDRYSAAGRAHFDPPGSDLLEDPVLQLELQVDLLVWPDELVVTENRTDDRRGARGPSQPFETQTVGEQIRDRGLQRVEPGKRLLADRDQNVDAQPGRATTSANCLAKAPPSRW